MPRKHPILGIPVMTLDEFAKSEGATVGEMLEETYGALDQEAKAAQDKILAHPLDFLAGFYTDDEYPMPKWKAVIGLPTVKVSYGMRGSTEQFSGRVLSEDGNVYRVTAGRSHSDGSYLEPPDEDESIDWKLECETCGGDKRIDQADENGRNLRPLCPSCSEESA